MVELWLLKRYIKVQTRIPVNVTLFGNRVFEMRSYWIRVAPEEERIHRDSHRKNVM